MPSSALVRLPIVLALTALSALPLLASAQNGPQCRHTQPRELALQLDGVRTVRFEIGNSKLRVDGVAQVDPVLRGRACASTESRLGALVLEQRRDGDTLHVTMRRPTGTGGWMGNQYAYLDLAGQVPANVLVQAVIGSGDAWVTGVAAASADVGSGDAELRRIAGRVTAKVGSGDIIVDDAGELKVLSIGSGDVEARNVRGPVEVGSVGSGDLTVDGAAGDVRIGSLGSGDIDLRAVRGDVHVGSIGSGDLDVRDVDGGLQVDSKGSGDIAHRNVRGDVSLPRRR